jgi:hypothetical protein
MIPFKKITEAKSGNGLMTHSAQPTVIKSSNSAHAVTLDKGLAQKLFTPTIPIIINHPIPDVSTRNGNVFNDRFDKNTLWYLPVFNLIGTTDSNFSFLATQSALPNQSGDAFYVADLKFTVHSDVPADATAAKTANPALNLKEITLQMLSVSLSIAYSDSQGKEAHTSYQGSVQAADNGNYTVDFPAVIGNHVVILFENLKVTGSAQISFSATYPAWRPAGTSRMFFFKSDLATRNLKPMIASRVAETSAMRFETLQPLHPSVPTNGFNENQTFYQTLDLDKKYNENEYQLSYKIKTDAGTRPIIDVSDLKNLEGSLTEFSELKTIDLSKYPSISSLYIGVISRVIIVVPRSYVIVRNSLACSAACIASVDTTPGSAESCMFQFQFELTPAADPIDFISLLKEIQQNNDLQSYTLKFAENLSEKSASDINSVFTTDTSYNPAATPQNFFLTTTIIDKPGQSAIVNANLFIQQLCNVAPACGLGTISLKLDDNFPRAVPATVTLSLPVAKSDDGISWSIDTNAKAVVLSNSTSFDFLLQRYVFCSDAGIGDIVEANIPIATGASTNIPLPENLQNLGVILDYAEQRNGPVDRTNIARYMEIKTQDAQNVQYFIGVNSSQVNYVARNIKQIDIQTRLTIHPEINVPQFSLMNQNTAAGTKIMLPLQFAVTSLDATLSFSISFSDPTTPAVSISKENDFITNPIFDLLDTDLPT